MPGTLEHFRAALNDQPERRSGKARLGKLLVGRRAIVLAPVFAVALWLAWNDESPPPPEVVAAASGLVVVAWLLRIWATGFRTWAHRRAKTGERHLMSAGPYAWVRHPLYVANGIAGVGGLVACGQPWFLLGYVPAYLALTAFVVAREEEVLEERFGEEHARYRAIVPAFVPRPGRVLPRAERSGAFSWEPILRSFEPVKLVGIILVAAMLLSRCQGAGSTAN